jgi:6-methylsalicylate decarboxylase
MTHRHKSEAAAGLAQSRKEISPFIQQHDDRAWPKHRQTIFGVMGPTAGIIAGAPRAADTNTPAVADSDAGTQPVQKRRRIDVHAHYITEKYRAALQAAGHGRPSGMHGIPAWSMELAIATMNRLDIGSALLSVSAPGLHFGDDTAARELARHLNDAGAEAVRRHPTRFGLFASLPLPDVDGSLEEARYAFDELQADGVVLETNHNGVYLGDRRFDPVFEELNRREAVIFIHPTDPYCPCCQDPGKLEPLGYPYPMIEFMFETTRAVFNLILSGTLERFPKLKIIVPHAGATVPVLAERVAASLSMLELPNRPDAGRLFGALRGLFYDVAGFPEPHQLGPLLQVADHSKVMYGSDWPFTPEPAVLALAKKLEESKLMSPSMKDAVMRGNALALFPRFK